MILPQAMHASLLLAMLSMIEETSAAFAPFPPSGLCRGVGVAGTSCTRSGAAFILNRLVKEPATAASVLLHATNPNEGDAEEDDDKREGMQDAFAALDALSSLDDEGDQPSNPSAAEGVGMIDFDGSPEEEARMMQDMMSELESEGEEGMYSSVLGEMGGGGGGGGGGEAGRYSTNEGQSTSGVGFGKVLEDADGIGSVEDDDAILTFKPSEGGSAVVGEPDMGEFMTKAIREAVNEARSKTPDEIAAAGPSSSQSVLDDEEMMKEINDLFDDANKKLVESIKDIQVEQAALAKKSAQDRRDAVQETEERLAEAEAGAARLMETVARETAEVERALADLERAKDEMNADPMTKMADLKGGGIVKQGAFVGAVLFSIRALAEAAQMAGPGGEAHFTAAAIQGIIAAACVAYLALS